MNPFLGLGWYADFLFGPPKYDYPRTGYKSGCAKGLGTKRCQRWGKIMAHRIKRKRIAAASRKRNRVK
jgi:hypothetical protein